jgi:hypothetical protein
MYIAPLNIILKRSGTAKLTVSCISTCNQSSVNTGNVKCQLEETHVRWIHGYHSRKPSSGCGWWRGASIYGGQLGIYRVGIGEPTKGDPPALG